ncbi:hypothetical protein [Halomonas faecis]|uniref:hypothetical protein n=1 Tax=Halomonas faecis TaxID=1562110 RepID=UPI0013D50F4E|nr:hypothetical protein [Halomonas faecis]
MTLLSDTIPVDLHARLYSLGACDGSELCPGHPDLPHSTISPAEQAVLAFAGLMPPKLPPSPTKVMLQLLEMANLSTPETRAVAWLLPAIEQTAVTGEGIRRVFGDAIADLVLAAAPGEAKGEVNSIEEMLAQERAAVTQASSLGQTLAVCAIIADLETDSDGAVDLLDNYAAWLEGATKAQPFLRNRAQRSIQKALEESVD